jgi:hypothetical protein
MDDQAIFSQLDSRWGRETLGQTPYTIKSWGCTITSIARINFLLNNEVIEPGKLAKTLLFNNQGMLYWSSLDRINLRAARKYGTPSKKVLEEHSEKMIIELRYNPRHWVTLEGVNDSGEIKVMDPLKGDFVVKNINEISGYALLETINEPKPVEPTEYEKELAVAVEFVKEAGVSNGEDTDKVASRGEVFVMLKRFNEYLDKK